MFLRSAMRLSPFPEWEDGGWRAGIQLHHHGRLSSMGNSLV